MDFLFFFNSTIFDFTLLKSTLPTNFLLSNILFCLHVAFSAHTSFLVHSFSGWLFLCHHPSPFHSCFSFRCCTERHHPLVLLLISARGRASAISHGSSHRTAFPLWPPKMPDGGFMVRCGPPADGGGGWWKDPAPPPIVTGWQGAGPWRGYGNWGISGSFGSRSCFLVGAGGTEVERRGHNPVWQQLQWVEGILSWQLFKVGSCEESETVTYLQASKLVCFRYIYVCVIVYIYMVNVCIYIHIQYVNMWIHTCIYTLLSVCIHTYTCEYIHV